MTTKMDMCWIAAALLLYPSTSAQKLVSKRQIYEKVNTEFNSDIDSRMLEKHLVSWVDRQENVEDPNQGGSRSRYFFRTVDGAAPAANGDFRLYKHADGPYDGAGKTGKTAPEREKIPAKYHTLLDWYENEYFG